MFLGNKHSLHFLSVPLGQEWYGHCQSTEDKKTGVAVSNSQRKET